jgi:hypothetical protein
VFSQPILFDDFWRRFLSKRASSFFFSRDAPMQRRSSHKELFPGHGLRANSKERQALANDV